MEMNERAWSEGEEKRVLHATSKLSAALRLSCKRQAEDNNELALVVDRLDFRVFPVLRSAEGRGEREGYLLVEFVPIMATREAPEDFKEVEIGTATDAYDLGNLIVSEATNRQIETITRAMKENARMEEERLASE